MDRTTEEDATHVTILHGVGYYVPCLVVFDKHKAEYTLAACRGRYVGFDRALERAKDWARRMGLEVRCLPTVEGGNEQ